MQIVVIISSLKIVALTIRAHFYVNPGENITNQFYPPKFFFYSRPLFLIWYCNQKERNPRWLAVFKKIDVAGAFFKYSFVKMVDTCLALFKSM